MAPEQTNVFVDAHVGLQDLACNLPAKSMFSCCSMNSCLIVSGYVIQCVWV
jgi:hypothetical protein